jgi:hypothetical protein
MISKPHEDFAIEAFPCLTFPTSNPIELQTNLFSEFEGRCSIDLSFLDFGGGVLATILILIGKQA